MPFPQIPDFMPKPGARRIWSHPTIAVPLSLIALLIGYHIHRTIYTQPYETELLFVVTSDPVNGRADLRTLPATRVQRDHAPGWAWSENIAAASYPVPDQARRGDVVLCDVREEYSETLGRVGTPAVGGLSLGECRLGDGGFVLTLG